ncbi:TRAP transporter 4TM/12TM fusion protein [Bacillus chungangensis]|uniref:TRAP transporter 4TM/12TM fusion protein n=1 Tax=Bacillus chungangensis TaxID=587633 RepID=A0ABT9WZL5_9BACI|nr:TRAP transporter permease [Bacillus chungangensis]MDQ0178533.1 TRAP transporter 4TM/12TM fusion protein [Bacillus chungangensis]
MKNIQETISVEEQQKILEKFDPESGARQYKGWMQWVIFILLLSFSIFQLYTAIKGILPAQLQRSIHLGFALGLIFLLFPARKKSPKRGKIVWYDVILSLLGFGVGAYWPLNYNKLITSIGVLDSVDFYVGIAAILLVLEATRRVVGIPITIISILFLLYALYGPYMPGFLVHRGISLDRLVQTMFFTTEGILGTPLSVSSTFIFLFLLFGAFLVKTGVGSYFNDLAVSIAGRRTGGPAKVAIFSSALQGTISGSSVANVVTSGSFTIPMMKKLGYKREFAGGVEAAASTGGQLMPPIMGAAAFLMVEFIGGGITYWDIAKAAAIPALLYFTGIWIMTHFEAKRLGLQGLTKEEMPNRLQVFKKLYLLTPILAVIILLMTGRSVMNAALWSIVITIAVGFINRLLDRSAKFSIVDLVVALTDGARTALGVAAATACAGIIVGVVTKTGLGLKLGTGLLTLANDKLLLTLFFTMIASLILGMGSPTTANYVITSTIAAPAIILMGIPDLAAHLFVFYFGIMADITPPVALAAFAAAGVASGEPLRTGVNSAKLAIAAFIIPYMFVLSPELLMIDTTWYQLIWVVATAIAGMMAVGAGVIGYWYRRLNPVERLISIGAGLALIYPEGMTDFIGLLVFIGLIVLQFIFKGNKQQPSAMQG